MLGNVNPNRKNIKHVLQKLRPYYSLFLVVVELLLLVTTLLFSVCFDPLIWVCSLFSSAFVRTDMVSTMSFVDETKNPVIPFGFLAVTVVLLVHMGCVGSKIDDLPLVTLCRERKEFLKATCEHRYALAAAHVSYFQSLRDIGDALRKFADEELLITGGSSSLGSPVIELPSDDAKSKTRIKSGGNNQKNSNSSTSISEHSNSHGKVDAEDSHLHFSYGSDSDSESHSSSGHIHIDDSPEQEETAPPLVATYGYVPMVWNSPGTNHYAHYMKRSASPAQKVVYEEPESYTASTAQWPEPSSYGYQGYPSYGNSGFFGFPFASPSTSNDYRNSPLPNSTSPAPPPDPPSPPRVSTWDFLDVFDTYDANNYPGYYSQGRYGFGSTTSSPDSKEVREREGIPELEDETEHEVVKMVDGEKKGSEDKGTVHANDSGEGTSKPVPSKIKTVSLHASDDSNSVQAKDIKSSPDSIVSKSSEEEYARKKGVGFEVDEAPTSVIDGESSKFSSLTTLSPHGTRDIQEVVKEIRDEFETASGYGKEIALLLEVVKRPYRPRRATIKVTFSRILYVLAPCVLISRSKSSRSVRYRSRTTKMAQAFYVEAEKDSTVKFGNLSSTFEKLYVWEKKLYKEVKDEEKLRIIYEKQCKRLKMLDDRGAESTKIDATRASVRKLLVKINVCIKSVHTIASRIHRLRDEELQPQLTQLIHGLLKMWKCMLKCHHKQFQAIMESKTQSFKVNTGLQGDAGLKAIMELEMELLNWCTQFNNWVKAQKSYIESLHEWLMRCLSHEPEVTADGVAPFSPSRIGAPPIFVMCNDWHQAMKIISEQRVADAMHDFARKLHELWERHDEEQRQRIKAEYVSRDFQTRLNMLQMNMEKTEDRHVKMSDKKSGLSENDISPKDDLKVDLDLLKQKLREERARHKEAIKLVHDAASNSLQTGLIPIFKTLESFASEVVQAHEQVRLENAKGL